MPTRSAYLAHGTLNSATFVRMFTVPVSSTILVKRFLGWGFHSAAVTLVVGIGHPPAAPTQVKAITVPYASGWEWETWIVLTEGMELYLRTAPAGPTTYSIFGTHLPGVAPPLPATKPA